MAIMISSTSFSFSLSFPHTQLLTGTDGSSFKIEALYYLLSLYASHRTYYYSRSIAESLVFKIGSLAKVGREKC